MRRKSALLQCKFIQFTNLPYESSLTKSCFRIFNASLSFFSTPWDILSCYVEDHQWEEQQQKKFIIIILNK